MKGAKELKSAAKRRFTREESLGYLVTHLGRLFSRALERRLAKHGVALGQFPLLLILWEEEGITQSEIARRLHIEQPTVADTLRRMQRDGLIETAPDPANRRRILIGLTPKGRILEGPLTNDARKVNEKAARRMPAEEIQTFCRLLRKLEHGLTDGDADEPKPEG
jgi:DNA-binding MarR family transcriptional regulator